jgi:hypothetical protein
MNVERAAAAFLVLAVSGLTACSDTSSPRSLSSRDASSDLVPMEFEKAITTEEFAAANVNGVGGICVKSTTSGDVLMTDAHDETPSQPCPPAWQFVGKPMGIKTVKEWFTEDKNGNGLVCVKFVGVDKTIVKDDNANTPSQPCPPAFSPVGKAPSGPKVDADDLAAADADGDGMVCLNATASGNFIVRDDNNATPSQPCPPSWLLYSGKKGGDEPAPPAEPAAPPML